MLTKAAREGLDGAHAAKRRVWSHLVVVVVPGADQLLGSTQVCEDMLVQALLAESAVEALGKRVLHGLARSDEVKLDAVCPGIQSLARELGTVVDHDRLREAVQLASAVEHARHSLTSNGRVHLDGRRQPA